jgi:hypothetical protein
MIHEPMVGWVGRCKGEAVAPEDVVNYLEGATTKAL